MEMRRVSRYGAVVLGRWELEVERGGLVRVLQCAFWRWGRRGWWLQTVREG